MNGAFYVGATGLQAQERALQLLANNIANMNTTAFKRSDVRFAEVMAVRGSAAAPADSNAVAPLPLAGVRLTDLFTLETQGDIERSGNALDLAIDGRGFVELMGPAGQSLLWRGGALKVNADGMLATAGGIALRAAITVPRDASAIEIGRDGLVRAVTSDAPEGVEIGQIMLARIEDVSAIERLDGGLYRLVDGAVLTDAQPGEDGSGALIQGALERSNVTLNTEMVGLMMVQRAYAANAQIIQASDQLMGIANGLKK